MSFNEKDVAIKNKQRDDRARNRSLFKHTIEQQDEKKKEQAKLKRLDQAYNLLLNTVKLVAMSALEEQKAIDDDPVELAWAQERFGEIHKMLSTVAKTAQKMNDS